MPRFNVGNEIVMARITSVQEILIENDYPAEDFFHERDLAFVSAINEDGSVREYEYARYYGYNSDTDEEYELDQPEPNGSVEVWNNDLHPEFAWYTLEMLESLKSGFYSTNKLDIICSKVLQLYRKHNNSNATFKWKGI